MRQHADELALRAPGRLARAHTEACRERPAAAALVERGKRITEARALHERLRTLERARERETDPREVLRAERQIRDIAEQLSDRGALGRELPSADRRSIGAADERGGKTLVRAAERDWGLTR